MINIGIIGLGDMGLAHVRGFNMLDDCRVTAVCDTDIKRIDAAREVLAGKKFESHADYRDLLKQKNLDAVVIAVYNYRHEEVSLAALKSGRDIFLEKPVAHTIESCDNIIKTWGATESILQIGFTYRYSSMYRHVARMIEKGALGEIMMAYCIEFRDNFPLPWFFDEEKSGGAIVEKNCHHFDIFNWMIKSSPLSVYAAGGQHVVKGKNYEIKCSYAREKGIRIDNPSIVDHAFITVAYENSAVANLGLCMYESPPIDGLRIGMVSVRGEHAVIDRDSSLELGGGPKGENKKYSLDMKLETFGIGHIGCQLQRSDFLKSIKKRSPPFADIFTGRDAALICYGAEKSIKEKRPIQISEFDDPIISELSFRKGHAGARPTPEPANPLLKG